MMKCLHVKESPPGSNRGDSIDVWRKQFGFKRPVPWCAIFVSIKSRQGGVIEPKVWSALARRFIVRKYSKKLSDIIYGYYLPKAGDYRVKNRKGGNHVDVFVSWDKDKNEGLLIGGNVDNRVKVRKVSLRSMIADGTTHITAVRGRFGE